MAAPAEEELELAPLEEALAALLLAAEILEDNEEVMAESC
jgi:hypothetical protein